MTRAEFMKELSRLLQDIPAEEREEALQYYEGYFEDAGPEAEAEVIRELESPQKVADMVKSGMGEGQEGAFTERGYEEPGQSRDFEVANRKQERKEGPEQAKEYEQAKKAYETCQKGGPSPSPAQPVKRRNGWRAAFWILLAVITFPLWISVAAVAFALVIALIAGVGGLLFGLTVGTIAMTGGLLVSGIGLVGSGIASLFVSPFVGFLLLSSGVFVTGLGMLGLCLAILVIWKVIPVCVRGIINLCSWPFRKRRATA